MCKVQHTTILPEKNYRLADFFRSFWDEYCKNPKKYIESHQYKAANSIMVCRTEALGIEQYVCTECGDVSEIRHNCKNRFCPTCSWLDTVKWAERIKTQMYNIPHRHVVFTLPHSLIPLIEKNPKELYQILQRTSADTFKDWISSKYNLKCGVISVLHTFGEKKNLHVHVHMIVSWGGVDLNTKELKKIEDNFVKYTFLQTKFRCKFEDELIEHFDQNLLTHKFINRPEFLKFLKKINAKNWQIHLEEPIETPAEVIRYIGRYSKRCCLSEYKITNIHGEYITFKYKDYKEKDENQKAVEKELQLHYSQFFPLLLQHVPLPGFRMVKYYGAYAQTNRIPQEYKCKTEEIKISEQIEEDYQTSEENPKYCKNCEQQKQYLNTIIKPFNKQNITELITYKKQISVSKIKLKAS